MKDHWKQNVIGGLAVAGIAWASLFVWCFIKTTYEDHMNLAARVYFLRRIVDTDAERNMATVSACKTDLLITQASLHDEDRLATALQTTLTSMQGPQAQQAANIATCITNLAKTNPIIKENVQVIQVLIGSMDANSRYIGPLGVRKRSAWELLIITNESEPSFHGSLRCPEAFTINKSPEITTNVRAFTRYPSYPVPLSDREYELRFEQTGTEWNPSHPAYLQVFSATSDLGQCIFTRMD